MPLSTARLRPAALIAWCALAVASVALPFPPWLALPFAVSFLVLGPGLALAHLLRPSEPAAMISLALGFSLACLVVAAQAQLLMRVFAPHRTVWVLAALTVFGLLWAEWRRRPSEVDHGSGPT
jgi:hypothetical protein